MHVERAAELPPDEAIAELKRLCMDQHNTLLAIRKRLINCRKAAKQYMADVSQQNREWSASNLMRERDISRAIREAIDYQVRRGILIRADDQLGK